MRGRRTSRDVRPSPPAGRTADLLLPGAGALAAGRARGLLPLAVWLGSWALAVARRDRILEAVAGGGAGAWLALLTLVGLLGGAWAWGNGHRGGGGAPSRGAEVWRRFRGHRQALAGLGLVTALAAVALLAPFLAPYDPAAQGDLVLERYLAPSLEHPMGTDRFGRDVLSRVLYGARVSLAIGFLAVTIAITLGTAVGAAAGYVGGWLDTLSMRGVDLLLSFPRLVLLVTVAGLFDPSIALVTLILGLTGWMGTSRIVRGEVLSVREREFVQAARALGFRESRILLRHVLPNVLGPVIVAATLGIGNTILAEAALSFLGLGVQPPAASWGNMVAAGRDAMLEAWWITAFPGLAIVFTVMSFNLVGDGLRDALDPRTLR